MSEARSAAELYALQRRPGRGLRDDEIEPWRQFGRLSVAPMMDVSDRHFRFLMRLLTRKTKLYTEMKVDQTLLYNQHPAGLEYFLGHAPYERPLAVQLGGNDPSLLGQAAKLCEEYGGFDEINLNCGCPSPKVAKDRGFGARLMLEPGHVREILAEMTRQVCRTEVTVKCRIGADDRDSYPELCEFVHDCRASGVRHFIVHARKCMLDGLSTSQNRSVPPLYYPVVHRLAHEFPELRFTINGGIRTLEAANTHLLAPECDGPRFPPALFLSNRHLCDAISPPASSALSAGAAAAGPAAGHGEVTLRTPQPAISNKPRPEKAGCKVGSMTGNKGWPRVLRAISWLPRIIVTSGLHHRCRLVEGGSDCANVPRNDVF